MTVRDVAAELGVTKARVDQFIKNGQLKVATRAGGMRWLSRKAVAKFKRLDRPAGRPQKRGGKS